MKTITKLHSGDGVESAAVYSPCERYRYSLTRVWDPAEKRLLIVMLNPSKATELANDPTVERCERRARRLGYGAMRVCNIFAWRETRPDRLKRAKDPVGSLNDAALTEAAEWADHVLCAWGVHGIHRGQGHRVAALLADGSAPLFALGETKAGHPRHPLYVGYKTPPLPWIADSYAVTRPSTT
ncbi:MAG: DUF1643 domain-containing protein [Boseongicola sp.]